ncbi:MAG TPA: condensation domain-containing protein, partial [Thermoanaerobaculia bacterium]|nr:condensation domain-containing protein [Thermoanaerobaculia bacterium]
MSDSAREPDDFSPEEDEVYVAPASFAQQRLWSLDRILPGLPTYNVPLGLRLSGPLREDVLALALGGVVERHETLRTALGIEDGEAVQLISPWVDLPLPRADLAALPEPVRDEEVLRLLREGSTQPLDLAVAPLLRAVLFRLEPEERVLFLLLHHAVTDAVSVEILMRDLFEIYDARLAGRPPRLPELTIQYADYAAWQRQWLSGEALEMRLQPWRRRLAGAPFELRLPSDRPRTGKVDPRGAVVPFHWPDSLHAAVHAWTRETGLTSYMTVLAAFQALLARHSGQDDLLVGSPVANRNRVQTENVVGLFANVVVLRGDMRDGPTFREHAARAREATLEAFDAEDLPFEKLVEDLRPERRLDQNPLFQVAFGFQKQPLPPGHAETGLVLRAMTAHSGTAKFELTLTVTEDPAWFQGAWEYSTALFDATTVARLATHMEVLLADALANPGRRLGELALLTAAERHQLLSERTDSAAPYPRDAAIHELFAAQVE